MVKVSCYAINVVLIVFRKGDKRKIPFFFPSPAKTGFNLLMDCSPLKQKVPFFFNMQGACAYDEYDSEYSTLGWLF